MIYLQQGTLLQGGKYKIIRHISSGGFGNTYEGYDVSLNKRVAIKEFFVKDFCGRDSETTLVNVTAPSKAPLIEHLKRRFMEEARAIANMEHENIVRVHALFEENGTAYYVMDYIDGESVHALLKRRGSLPESEALPIIVKVADALGYMHRQNRFHLDIKPANIMLRRDGKVVLIDFGSSKQYAEVDGENTTTFAPCYTPGYAPSEQMNPAHTTFTAATDIYALGATLYKMLTGQTPPSAISLMHGDETLSPLPNVVSPQVKACVQKAMVPQRGQRVQSIEEWVKMMEGKSTDPISQKWRLFNPRYHTLLNILLYLIAVPHVAGAIAALFHGDPLLVSPTMMILAVMSVIIVIANVNMLRGKWKGVIYWYVAAVFLCMAVVSDSIYKELFFYETKSENEVPPSLVWALVNMLVTTSSLLLTPFVLCIKKNGISGWNVLAESRKQDSRIKKYFSLDKMRLIATLLSTVALVLGLLYCYTTIVKYNEFEHYWEEMQNKTSKTTAGTTTSAPTPAPTSAPAKPKVPAKPKAKPKQIQKKATPKPDDSEENYDDDFEYSYGRRY